MLTNASTPDFTKQSMVSASASPMLDLQAVINEDEYPPQDSGRGAYMFLFGACVIEITAWGFPYCYGVFQAYFDTHLPFQGQSLVSVGGVLSNVRHLCLSHT